MLRKWHATPQEEKGMQKSFYQLKIIWVEDEFVPKIK